MEVVSTKNLQQKKGPKLIKDLKYGKVNLRQSLLQFSEIEDIKKIFLNKKEQYSIVDQDINFPIQKSENNEEDIQILMSPLEKIQIYRKEKINKQIKAKMNKMIRNSQPERKYSRVPKTTKMLQNFQQKYKKEIPISYKQGLRESETNLNRIKMNNRRKFQTVSNSTKPLYQSRIQNCQLNSSVMQSDNSCQKKRFMSLKTSLPEKQKFTYPSIRQIIHGKNKNQHKGPIINMKIIEIYYENFINQNFKKIKLKNQTQENKYSILHSPKKKPQTSYLKIRNQKRNVQRSFTRSEESSQQVLNTMTGFYQIKHSKKSSYDQMLQNLKYDRPLTSSLRRKNYTVLGKDTLNPIKEYRQTSEQERQKIQEHNHEFYMKVIEGLEGYHEEDVPTTIFILEQVRRIFEMQYIFTEDILKQLIQSVKVMDLDCKTEEVLEKIGNFVGYKINIQVQN